MSCLILLDAIVLVTTYSMYSVSKSFTYILNNRLIPSKDITLIQRYCYQNQLSNNQVSVGKSLYAQDGNIMMIITIVYSSLCVSLVVAAHLLKVLGIKYK